MRIGKRALGGGAGGGGTSPWVLAWDAGDLSAVAAHDYLVDGATAVVNGVTLTRKNNANADQMEFDGSTGLVIQSSSGTNWTGGTFTGPYVSGLITDMLAEAGITWDNDLHVALVGVGSVDSPGGAGDRVSGLVVGGTNPSNDRLVDSNYWNGTLHQSNNSQAAAGVNVFGGSSLAAEITRWCIEIQGFAGRYLLRSDEGTALDTPDQITIRAAGRLGYGTAAMVNEEDETATVGYAKATDHGGLGGYRLSGTVQTRTFTGLGCYYKVVQ